jgi:flagellar hook-length control protein FliK
MLFFGPTATQRPFIRISFNDALYRCEGQLPMLNSLPLADGPKAIPGGAGASRMGSASQGSRNENRDPFAATLNKVRGEKDPSLNTDRAQRRTNPDAKIAPEREKVSKRPGEAEATEGENAPTDVQGTQSAEASGKAADATPKGTAAVGTTAQVAEGDASKNTVDAGHPLARQAAKEGSGLSGSGENATVVTAREAARGGDAGSDLMLTKAVTGNGKNGASASDPVAAAKTGSTKDANPGTPPMAAKQAVGQEKIQENAPRFVTGTAQQTAAPQSAPGAQTDATKVDPDVSPGAKRPVDMAQGQAAGVPKGSPANDDTQADSGSARNRGGRSDHSEGALRPTQGGERHVEGGTRFGEMIRESSPAHIKDDAGALGPRQGLQDGSQMFSSPMAPKTAAAAHGGTSASATALPAAESFAQDNFHHLVERALFSVRGGQSEARIALKPDHLGHVRMQIITENQAVSIKIVAESPVARDLIDANAHQLRSELQQQGLNVQTIEVAVSDDQQDAYRGARQREAFLRHLADQGTTAGEEDAPGAVPGPSARPNGRSTAAGIDYFA